MCDIKVKDILPDGEYRAMILQLSSDLELEDLKYMLRSLIPDGKSERLTTTLQVFVHLENLLFVGPRNLRGLRELLG